MKYIVTRTSCLGYDQKPCEEAVKEIKEGKVAIKLDERVTKNGTRTVDVTFVESELPF